MAIAFGQPVQQPGAVDKAGGNGGAAMDGAKPVWPGNGRGRRLGGLALAGTSRNRGGQGFAGLQTVTALADNENCLQLLAER